MQQCNANSGAGSRAWYDGLTKPIISVLLLLSFKHSTFASDIPSHAVVLLYHHVSDSTPAITSVSPTRFEQHLKFIEDKQFKVWPLDKIVSHFNKGLSLPDKVLAITFDDAYLSVYTEAFPRLKKRAWPFTVFVSTDAIDQRYRSHTNWPQLREMAGAGATIANHSASHQHLLIQRKNESEQQWQKRIEQDIVQAQQRIKQETGASPLLFAYPYGEFNQGVKNIVAKLSMTGLGQQSGAIGPDSDRLALARFPVAGNYTDIDDFAVKLMSLPMPITDVSATDNPLDHTHSKPSLTLTFSPDHSGKISSLQCFGSGQGRLLIDREKNQPDKVIVRPNKHIPVGRSRFNCTLSGPEQRFYWFSHPWIRLAKDNQWPEE